MGVWMRPVRNADGPSRVSWRRGDGGPGERHQVRPRLERASVEHVAWLAHLSSSIARQDSEGPAAGDRRLRLALEGAFDVWLGMPLAPASCAAWTWLAAIVAVDGRRLLAGRFVRSGDPVAADASRPTARHASCGDDTRYSADRRGERQSRSGRVSGRGQHRVLDGQGRCGCSTVRPLNQLSRVVLPTRNAFSPFVSADSASVGFSEESDRTLKKSSSRAVHRSRSVLSGELFAARVGGRTARSCLVGRLAVCGGLRPMGGNLSK